MNVEGMSQEIRGAGNLERRAGDGFEEETRRGARQRGLEVFPQPVKYRRTAEHRRVI